MLEPGTVPMDEYRDARELGKGGIGAGVRLPLRLPSVQMPDRLDLLGSR